MTSGEAQCSFSEPLISALADQIAPLFCVQRNTLRTKADRPSQCPGTNTAARYCPLATGPVVLPTAWWKWRPALSPTLQSRSAEEKQDPEVAWCDQLIHQNRAEDATEAEYAYTNHLILLAPVEGANNSHTPAFSIDHQRL